MKTFKQHEEEILEKIAHFRRPVAAFSTIKDGRTMIRKVPVDALYPQNMKTLIGIYNKDCQPGYIVDDLRFIFGEQE